MCTIDGNKCPDCVYHLEAEVDYWQDVASALIHKNVKDGIWTMELKDAPAWVSIAFNKIQQEKKEGKK